MGTEVARLTKAGDFTTIGNVDTGTPTTESGLVLSAPFDGNDRFNLWQDGYTGSQIGNGTVNDRTHTNVTIDPGTTLYFSGEVKISGGVNGTVSLYYYHQNDGAWSYQGYTINPQLVEDEWAYVTASVLVTGVGTVQANTRQGISVRNNVTQGLVEWRNLQCWIEPSTNINSTQAHDGLYFEAGTTNMIPGGVTNMYPTVGNGHGTFNTNQYNSNTDFSIGTIGSVSSNIVTLSTVSRTLRTYDVLNPATTGGGVTAGVHYYIKMLSSNTFTLHAYDSTNDGSKGYRVHDSIINDERVSVSASGFPTMWHGTAHKPNSSLVKEIIPNGFVHENRVHECIRLHSDHKSGGSADGMAYGVNPALVAGTTYTFSFYYRAANAYGATRSMGTNGYAGSNIPMPAFYPSKEWQRYSCTFVSPSTASMNMYWWPALGTKIDISEIQLEEKGYQTSFTTGTRNGGPNLKLPDIYVPKQEGTFCLDYTITTDTAHAQYGYALVYGGWSSPIVNDWVAIYRGTGWADSDSLNVGVYDGSAGINAGSTNISGINSKVGHTLLIYVGWSVASSEINILIYDKTTHEILRSYSNSAGAFDGFDSNVMQLGSNGGSPPGGKLSNFCIYSRLLSISEMTSNANRFTITQDATVKMSSIETKPVWIDDSYNYHPLQINSYDIHGNGRYITESNTDYSTGEVWIGESATNMLPDSFANMSDMSWYNVGGWHSSITVDNPTYYHGRTHVMRAIKTGSESHDVYPSLSNIATTQVGDVYVLSYDTKTVYGDRVYGWPTLYHDGWKLPAEDQAADVILLSDTELGGGWIRRTFQYTITYAGSALLRFDGGYTTVPYEMLVDNVQFEKRTYATPLVVGTRPAGVLDINSYNLDGQFTIVWRETQVSTTGTHHGMTIVDDTETSTIGTFTYNASNTLRYTQLNNSVLQDNPYITSGIPVLAGTQFEIALTRQSDNKIRVYFNGVLKYTATNTITATFTKLFVGNRVAHNGNYADAYFRDLVVLEQGLLDSEIAHNYKNKMNLGKDGKLTISGSVETGATL